MISRLIDWCARNRFLVFTAVALVVALGTLVDHRAVAAFDFTVTASIQPLAGPGWDELSSLVAILFATEVTLVYGLALEVVRLALDKISRRAGP